MNDIFLQAEDLRIDATVDGMKLTLTWSDDPTHHYVYTLRDEYSYDNFKRWINGLYADALCPRDGVIIVNDMLQTTNIYEFVSEEDCCVYIDTRTRDEIDVYLTEAEDKVWLMRSCYIPTREPAHEASRPAMERILATYGDIPEEGYDSWECGYWNGIMSALRWVNGLEKNFLDT